MDRQLRATVTLSTPADAAWELLRDEPASILTPHGSGRDRHVPVDLRIESDAGAVIAHRVLVEIDHPDTDRSFPFGWVPVGRRRLLPVFTGWLTVTEGVDEDESVLTVDGVYHPPLGVLGAFGDGLIGHRVARACLHDLLVRMATELTAEARRRRGSMAWRPAVGHSWMTADAI